MYPKTVLAVLFLAPSVMGLAFPWGSNQLVRGLEPNDAAFRSAEAREASRRHEAEAEKFLALEVRNATHVHDRRNVTVAESSLERRNLTASLDKRNLTSLDRRYTDKTLKKPTKLRV